MRDLKLVNADGYPFRMKAMDIQYGPTGQVVFVDDVQMIDQLITKAFMTNFSSNPIRPLYGAAFNTLIGKKLEKATSALMMITEAERVVNRITTFTQQNLNFTPDQRIVALQDVILGQGADPRVTSLTTEIVTESGNSIKLLNQIPTNTQ